jgi:hypothetical protein
MRETALFAEHIVVEREIKTLLGVHCFQKTDTINK